MRVIYNEADFTGKASVLALGMFDGVHEAHQALIRRAVALARQMSAQSVVCTFDRHPVSVLFPEKKVRMLLTTQQRLEKIQALGADWALVKPFTRELADIPAEDFLRSFVEGMRAKAVVAGFNYTFGKDAAGNVDMIRSLAGEMGYVPEIVEPVLDHGERVSSTLIRTLLENGQEERAQRLMNLDV